MSGLSHHARFVIRVDMTGDGCWEWRGSRTARGYGRFSLGRMSLAHRAAWHLFVGPIDAGLVVMHTCDNPPCVRPSHLRLGTMADNQGDMARKGRAASGDRNGSRLYPGRRRPGISHQLGEANGQAKLTAAVVREMRERRMPVRDTAATYGISKAQASRILSGKRWPHV